MLIRETDKIECSPLPPGCSDQSISGKALMHHPYDDMNFAAYYVTIPSGQECTLGGMNQKAVNEEPIKYSHAYYCTEGLVTITSITDNNKTMGPYIIKEDSFHIFPSSVKLLCNFEKETRMVVIYVPEDGCSSNSCDVISATNSQLKGGPREVDWGKGISLRYLIREDKYPLTITHCSYENGSVVNLEYDEYLKTNIFIKGSVDVKYGPDGLEKSCKLQCSNKDSIALVSANENDRHSLAPTANCVAINVFSPALKGTEVHHWSSKQDYSGFGS